MPRARWEWKVQEAKGGAAELQKLLEAMDVQRYEIVAILSDHTVIGRKPAPAEEINLTLVPAEDLEEPT